VTVVGAGVKNLTIVVLNNGLYEVTGGQKTPAARAALDLAGMARAAGFPTAEEFQSLADWQGRARHTLALPGPRFISLAVQPTPKEFLRGTTPQIGDQLNQLRQALESSSNAWSAA
jgi:thiamine pyrophosphate-dependent acetolactate synthase large subunit-like protein